jgi:hypothetical protein
LAEAGAEKSPWASETVEVIPLQTSENQRSLTFVLNHGAEDIELPLPRGQKRTDILNGVLHAGTVPLPGFGVVLLQG